MPRAADRDPLPAIHRTLAGVLVGAQVVVAAAVVPMTRRLDEAGYLRVHTDFTRRADLVLPLLGGATTGAGYLRFRRGGRVADLVATAALVVAGAAASGNLRINDRVRDAHERRSARQAVDTAWLPAARERWARAHLVRVAGGVAALAAALTSDGPRTTLGRPRRGSGVAALDAVMAAVAGEVARTVVVHLAHLRTDAPLYQR